MSQDHGGKAVGSENEAQCPGRMVSLSRQGIGRLAVNLGSIVGVSNPIHQEDWTGATIKVVLE